MPIQLTSDEVWQAIERDLFAVLGMVTAQGEARTVGIVYIVRNRKLYIGTDQSAWKARHVAANPHVSITIPIAKRIFFLPWIKIPAATITFAGTARIIAASAASAELLQAVFRVVDKNAEQVANSCIIEVTPEKEFVTYGVGVPLMRMRQPEKARGRAPVL